MTLILGIESSCDETGASIVQDGWLVRSNVVATQHNLHERYGGVVPEIASRAHIERISPVLQETLSAADVALADVDAIAVGNRPGLIGSLLVGLSSAKALAWMLDKPLIGIDHVEAHMHAGLLKDQDDLPDDNYVPSTEIECPAIGLVVSGGHTSMYLLTRNETSQIQYQLIGKTIDDAIGEAYDKAANILHLGYPGGPKLDKLAQTFNPDQNNDLSVKLPRSMLGKQSLDFSFSGLKTALLYSVCGKPIKQPKVTDGKRRLRQKPVFERSGADLSEKQKAAYAWSFQEAAAETTIKKLNRAMEQYAAGEITDGPAHPLKSLVLGGGVSANSELRKRILKLSQDRSLAAVIPKLRYCLDNAAMIAGLAHHRLINRRFDELSLPAIATTGL